MDLAVPISRQTVERYHAGIDYYPPHARAAFGAMGADERTTDAVRVVAWLAAQLNSETLKAVKGVAVVSKSEIHTHVFGGAVQSRRSCPCAVCLWSTAI